MDETLRIAICEDSVQEGDRLLSILASETITNSCTVYRSAEELLAVYKPQMYDLLFMDIYMGGMNGVDAVSRIREIDEDISVVFVTTSEEFALESYRLSAMNYLVKPYESGQISSALRMALMTKSNTPSLTVRWDGRDRKVRLSQIVCLEVSNHQLLLYFTDGTSIHVYMKMTDVLPQLMECPFFQCHKSFCVNLNEVEYIDRELNCFVMTNGKNVPIRRNLISTARKVWEDYLVSRARRQK